MGGAIPPGSGSFPAPAAPFVGVQALPPVRSTLQVWQFASVPGCPSFLQFFPLILQCSPARVSHSNPPIGRLSLPTHEQLQYVEPGRYEGFAKLAGVHARNTASSTIPTTMNSFMILWRLTNEDVPMLSSLFLARSHRVASQGHASRSLGWHSKTSQHLWMETIPQSSAVGNGGLLPQQHGHIRRNKLHSAPLGAAVATLLTLDRQRADTAKKCFSHPRAAEN